MFWKRKPKAPKPPVPIRLNKADWLAAVQRGACEAARHEYQRQFSGQVRAHVRVAGDDLVEILPDTVAYPPFSDIDGRPVVWV